MLFHNKEYLDLKQIVVTMFPFDLLFPNTLPIYIRGFKVDYKSPISEPCPGCGGRTYRSVENRSVACCIRCRRVLDVYPDY